MSSVDWLVLCFTLLAIILYGVWKSRGTKNIDGFLLADRQLPWYHVGFSVMATQASAVTFLSLPGQGFSNGMGFIQSYFGLPLAMIVLCMTFIPAFRKLNVYTAYEYLETRFDLKTRVLTAFLFLLHRGISTGITIYAPALILSNLLNVNINFTILFTGLIVIAYTVYGGTKAVSHTQLFQMAIIFTSLLLCPFLIVHLLPENIDFIDSLHIAGKLNKLNAINTDFNLNDKYNVWSGIIGGFFLQLSYFGTDQSQVGRYLTGQSVSQSRLGLVMNGLLKIPMQFFILLIGVLVFVFYQFNPAPVFFDKAELSKVESGIDSAQVKQLEREYQENGVQKEKAIGNLLTVIQSGSDEKIDVARIEIQEIEKKNTEVRKKVTELIAKNNAQSTANDSNYIFLTFVTQYLPVGLVGFLLAIIILAAMGSTASGINALASTTVVDFYKRTFKQSENEKKYLDVSRWTTVAWGLFCIIVALYAGKLGNLIEAVNVLGSLFYGTILGIFLVAFYLKEVSGSVVFYSAIITQAFIIYAWLTNLTAFLWLNVIGCLTLMVIAFTLQMFKSAQNINK